MIFKVIEAAKKQKASDLHLTVGSAPVVRVNGVLQRMDLPVLTAADTQNMCCKLFNAAVQKEYAANGEVDFAFENKDKSRCRVNVFKQMLGDALSIRLIADKVPSCEELGLPEIIGSFALKTQGLVLISGATGSGKSTTLAAMIDKINTEKHAHIITLEDPVEYRHHHKNSIVNQRETGLHTQSFTSGLRSALREDSDVIMVGELRDKEAVAAALAAAETGHLVLATLHTKSAAAAISRIADMFSENKAQTQAQLADVLQGIVCQQLLPSADGERQIAAFEILTATPALRNLIREGKIQQIPSFIQTGKQFGMITMEEYMNQLARKGLIKYNYQG